MISISSTLACRRQLYEAAVFFSTSPFGQPFSGDDDTQKAYTGNPLPRNSFQGTYDMDRLVSCYLTLSSHVIKGPTGRPTVNWADPTAVRALNTALLVADYNVNPSYSYILPNDALVPPIPGRADYVHHIADLLHKCISNHDAEIPKGSGVIGFDIGTGASCIYSTIATSVYGWRMIASDINITPIESARRIVKANGHDDFIDIRHQKSDTSIFDGILEEQDERIDFCMCNPPFYYNREEFLAENARKLKGLAKSRGRGQLKVKDLNKVANKKGDQVMASSNNFGGLESEIICKGGEVRFVKRIFNESKMYWNKCLWFTTLVSRNDNLKKIKSNMKKKRRRIRKGDREVKMIDQIPIGAGKKRSNILLCTFMDEDERRDWARRRNWNQ